MRSGRVGPLRGRRGSLTGRRSPGFRRRRLPTCRGMRGGIATFLRHRIDPLLETIEQQRRVVDAGPTHPGSWRGPIRREFTKGAAPKQRARVAAAFDHLVGLAGGGYIEITPGLLLDLHARCTPEGGSYRDREVKVGPFLTTAPFRRVSQLVEKAFDRAHDGVEPPLLAATRLHMELLLIHPLRDGNGRAVRLVIAAMLLNAGYKSTLFTAVEQHSHIDPPRYGKSFTPLRAGRPTQHEPWLYSALDLMAQSSGQAARYRSHETALRTILQGVKLRPALHDQVMLDHDLGRQPPHRAVSHLQASPRWTDLMSQMTPAERSAVRWQVERLLAEESDVPSRR